ncbi:MAG: ABC transporter substrate-binding protein [Beggiatoa sp. IS2]|nr:MAG: ABC transporter substrate-binding protein [Beggiatoa sp. IS2]
MQSFRFTFILVILVYYSIITAHAAPSAALGYAPKYPAGFSHFDYVNPDAPKGGEIVLERSVGNFDSFNPFLLKGIAPEAINILMFESLLERSLDEPFSLYGLLAEDVILAEDKLSVTFRLNPKARFSDGSEVTAEDVKFSFDTLRSDRAHPQYSIYWNDIQKAEIVDKYTIRFNFAKVNPELYLIAAEIPVFSKAAVGNKAFDEIVTEPLLTSGPYTIDKHQMGKTITYKRNPNYWAKDLNSRHGMFNFDKVTVKYYKDSSIAIEALKAGEFDFMDVYHSKEWARDYVGPKFDSGAIKKVELVHQNNAGMQAFVFNLRRPFFQDIRVRTAINLAFDFEWANQNLFYNQYQRCNSYFSNSELAATGLPAPEELALLKPLQEKFPRDFPETALTQAWQPVSTAPPNSLRDNLRKAKDLLTAAGWQLKDEVLQNAEGRKLEFEVILAQAGFDRILAPFARNLEKLGIKLSYRTIDAALYQRRMNTFDFDMTIHTFGQSQSPGNELMSIWHSNSAKQEGSNNLLGLQNPVVDALIEHIIYAPDRQALVTAARALDRVMLQGEYVVPNWYINKHRIAYWDKFGRPTQEPLYYVAGTLWVLQAWWRKP